MKITAIRISFLVLVILIDTACFAQSNYKKGFLITTGGDTLTGFINYRESYINPREVTFKSVLDETKAVTYTLNKLLFVEVTGYATYQKFPVTVSMNEVQFNKLTESTSQPVIKDTVFLKLLVKGKNVSLYSYRDQLKQRFYILEQGEASPVELGFKLALFNGSVVKFPLFQPQLIRLAEKFGDSTLLTRSAIEKSSYRQADMISITKSINGDTNSEPILTITKRKSRQFFLAAGINNAHINYTGENLITADGVDDNDNRMYKNRRSSTFLPLISVGTDAYFNQEIKRTYIKLEFSAAGMSSEVHSRYRFSSYFAEELSNRYRLSGVIFTFQPQFIVNIINKKTLKFYLGVAPSLNYFLAFKNEMFQKTNQQDPIYTDKQIDDFLKLKKVFAGVLVRTGVTINEKVNIYVSRSNPIELNSYMSSTTNAKYNSSQLSVAYNFLR